MSRAGRFGPLSARSHQITCGYDCTYSKAPSRLRDSESQYIISSFQDLLRSVSRFSEVGMESKLSMALVLSVGLLTICGTVMAHHASAAYADKPMEFKNVTITK